MSRKISIIIFSIAMVSLLLWASYSLINQKDEQHEISVILTGTSHDRWFAVKEGMEQAASDYKVILDMPDVPQYPTTNDEWDLVKQKIDEGADAIIVEPVGKNLLTQNDVSSDDFPIILLDSDVEPEGVYKCIHADDVRIGEMLAENIIKEYGNKLNYMKIGIVAGEASKLAMNQRLQGFYSKLKEAHYRSAWTLGLSRNLGSGLKRQFKNEVPDIVVSLGSLETEVVVDYIVAHDLASKVAIYGEGYSEKTVYYLEKGVIDCLVVPNEFTMGYLSVVAACKGAEHVSTSADNTIDLVSVRSDELYNEENQQILFPHIR